MSKHLSYAVLDALLYGELSAEAERAARTHLGACAECAERFDRLASAECEILGRLRTLDHPVPKVDAGGHDSGSRPPRRHTRS